MGSTKTAASFLTIAARAAACLGLGATLINSSLYTVDGGQRAVIFDRSKGVVEETVGEGTHFLLPWLQKPYIFNIRTRPHIFSSVSDTKDFEPVNITLRVLTHPDAKKLPVIFKTLGMDYDEKVLPSISTEVLMSVIAKFNSDQLLVNRSDFIALVGEGIIRRPKEFDIIVDDVTIVDLSYCVEFSKAVEKKQVAELEVERAKFLVEKSELETRAAIIRAEGESASAKMISDATATYGTGIIDYRRAEAAEEVVSMICKKGVMLTGRNCLIIPRKNGVFVVICRNYEKIGVKPAASFLTIACAAACLGIGAGSTPRCTPSA